MGSETEEERCLVCLRPKAQCAEWCGLSSSEERREEHNPRTRLAELEAAAGGSDRSAATQTEPAKPCTMLCGACGKILCECTCEGEPTKPCDCERLRDAAKELADLVDAVVTGDYKPDTFTTQPIRAALTTPPPKPSEPPGACPWCLGEGEVWNLGETQRIPCTVCKGTGKAATPETVEEEIAGDENKAESGNPFGRDL